MYKYENCVYHKSSKIWHAFKADNGNKIELYENGRYKFIESNLNKIHNDLPQIKGDNWNSWYY